MHRAELYAKSNYLQKRDAIKCLDEFGKKLQWKSSGARVLDIGCGDGGVTDVFRRNYMPPNYKQLVGCDISENMIKYAQEHYGDSRTEFHVLDIQEKVPEAFRESFDHIVSFTALHWVENQEAAFRNIHELLAENGDCLLLILGHMPLHDVYRILRPSKWGKWIKDATRSVTPYQDSIDPEKEITSMLEKIGFQNIEVTCIPNEFVFDDKLKWSNTLESVDPFDIPKDKFEAYVEDVTEVMRSINRKNNIESKDGAYMTLPYKSIIVYARK